MVIIMPKKYYTRIIENELDQLLGIFGAVLIEGPKWCGKTTTAETRAASRLLLMDPSRNFENRLRAETDPALAVSGEVPRLIDEWQEVPKLWDAARFECDNRSGEPGQFIFTGSATPRDDERPMHSGAGRFAKLRMDTMTLFELGKSSGAVKLSGIILAKSSMALSDRWIPPRLPSTLSVADGPRRSVAMRWLRRRWRNVTSA